MNSVDVEYIGEKPTKQDNVAGTGVVWFGKGDVRPVPAQAWPRLAVHTGVWRLFEERTESPAAASVAALVLADAAKTSEGLGNSAAIKNAVIEAPVGIYGTNHPALIEIDGEQVQLGTLVAAACAASGLSDEDWNALAEEDRHDFVEAEIEQRRNAAADLKVKAAADAAAAQKPASTDQAKALSNKELKAALTKLKVPFKGNASTADLQALLDAKKAGA